ncbi:hypothetical protein MPSEU_000146500 [Mayamaea pseudoterrestris]|nr:hypothetical protein MPSEU_000146500 [Mayamaea pseudoterrestris]
MTLNNEHFERSVDVLGQAPTAEQVDDWFTTVALYTKYKIGSSFQGRDLHIYSSRSLDKHDENDASVLLLSLVHGNEPAGLLSLLRTVQQLLSREATNVTAVERDDAYTLLRGNQSSKSSKLLKIIAFPIVNIDSYVANLDFGNGCRRTNMRQTCVNHTQPIYTCPYPSHGGVDLNRNHPMDWSGEYAGDDDLGGTCGITYKGLKPWSEPEARAVRDVVLKYRPTAAMSFHTRGLIQSEALLIHPFTSGRPVELLENLALYREWSRKMNDRNLYVTGTAQEAIQYTASGSTIDWMASQGVISFVMESRTPCHEGRWCSDEFAGAVKALTLQDGRTGTILVDLVAEFKTEQLLTNPLYRHLQLVLCVSVGILALLAVIWKRRTICVWTWNWKQNSIGNASKKR